MEQNPDIDLYDEFKRLERTHGRFDGGPRVADITVEKVRKNLIKYFKYIAENDKMVTISGMALHAGFLGRKDMQRYEDKPGYKELIDAAKSLIEFSYEVRLKMPDVKHTGIIFALKQLGWEDKQILEDSRGTEPEIAKILDKVPEKKLRAIRKLLSD